MKPAPFDYFLPGSLPEALALLAEHGDGARALAGGQSLVPMLNMRLVRPRALVSLRRLGELDFITRRNGSLAIGGMTGQSRVEHSTEVREGCPLLAEAIRLVGHPTIRNRGTIGGSIAHADPAAELPAVLVALDGRVTLAAVGGTRTVAASEFFHGMMATAAQPHELIVQVEFGSVGRPGDRRGHAFEELSRRHGDFALAGVAVALALDGADHVADARIALLGVEGRPRRRAEAESALRGERWASGRVSEAAALAASGLDALEDLQASREFRTHLVAVLARRALERAHRRAVKSAEEGR